MFPHSRKYGTYFFQDQSGTYYFRIVTPIFLRECYPNIQKEYRRSLGTANQRVAKSLAFALYIEMNAIFNETVDFCETADQVIKLIPSYLYLKSNLTDSKKAELTGMFRQIQSANKSLLESHYLEDMTKKQIECLDAIKNSVGVIIEMCEYDNSQLLLIQKSIESLESNTSKFIRRIERDNLVRNRTRATSELNIPVPLLEDDPTPEERHTLEGVVARFIEEKTQTKQINEKTSAAYVATFDLFSKLTQVLYVDEIDHKVCRTFKQQVQNIPVRLNSTPKYKSFSIQELLELDVEKISKETTNKHLDRVSAVFKWCIGEGYIDSNPMEGKRLKLKKKPKEDGRAIFTETDLNTIFSTEIYRENKYKHPYYFWLPLISLYSGARIQEICQLELDDIRKVQGILVFDINENSEFKRLKNLASRRLIPVHPKLIEFGLENELIRLKRLDKKYLFCELHKPTGNRDGQSTSASKWFGRLKNKLELDNVENKTFHSFRHTFLDKMRKRKIPRNVAACLAGHENSDITYGVYGGTLDVAEELFPAIRALSYDDVDFSHVNWKPK